MLYNTKKLYSYCTNFQEITRAAKGCEVANGCCWQEAGPRVVSAVGLSSLGLSASLSCRKSSSGDLGERLASCKWKKKKKSSQKPPARMHGIFCLEVPLHAWPSCRGSFYANGSGWRVHLSYWVSCAPFKKPSEK